MTAGLPLMKIVLTLLTKSALIPLRSSVGMSAADATIQKKIYGSGTTALIISNEEIEDMMKIVKSLEESALLMKRISEIVKNEAQKQKDRFLPMLLWILVGSVLGNALTGKLVITAGEGVIRTGQKF